MTDTIMPDFDSVPDRPPRVTSAFVVVDPDRAARWLTMNDGNRILRSRLVQKYARDMKAGQWRMTAESINFDWNGRLIEGQHRLHAIVQSGVTLTLHVVHGLDPDVQMFTGTGAPRTVTDALSWGGYKHTTTLGGCAKLGIIWTENGFRLADQQGLRAVSHSEIVSFVAAHQDMLLAVEQASHWRKNTPIRPTVLAFTVWLTNKVDPVDTDNFFGGIADKQTDGRGDPRLALMRRLDCLLYTSPSPRDS